ncbi:MAG: hypothetical protein K9M10_03600 [Candidatus Pacebacteria bacterium]|nr:hypothetical protein [Candidatus Paceibacterota bacterium]MCF7857536.1 hypothetical protein [Candidatus Paceibacterota bacterium]
MNKIILAISIFAVVLVPEFTHAEPIIRSGENISVDSTQVLEGDFYGFAPTVTISGPSENDVYVAGGTVTINAPVKGDLVVLGGVTQIHGDIGDDLRVVGGEVTLGREIKGDLVVLGGTLTVLSTARVDGDILFMGGELIVEGSVEGSIHGTADKVRINTKIGGDVSLTTGTLLVFGGSAEVLGSVTYKSRNDIVRAPNANIVGEVRRVGVDMQEGIGFAQGFAFQLAVLLFAALTCYLVFRKHIYLVMDLTMSAPGVSGLTGLGIFFIIPFIGALLLLSVLGTLIGVLILSLYIAALILSLMCAGVLLGLYIQKILTKKSKITLMTVVSGIASLCLLGLVPFVGGFIIFGLIVMSLGGISTSLYRTLRL